MFDLNKLKNSNIDFSVVSYFFYPNQSDRENALTLIVLHGYPSGNYYLIVAKSNNKCLFQDYSGNEIVNIEFNQEASTLELTDADDKFFIKICAKSFQLYEIGKTLITNPYQTLVDLGIVNQ